MILRVYMPGSINSLHRVNVGKMQVNILYIHGSCGCPDGLSSGQNLVPLEAKKLALHCTLWGSAGCFFSLNRIIWSNQLATSHEFFGPHMVFFSWDPLFQGSLGWWYHNLARIMGSQVIGALEIQFRTLPKKESNPRCWRVQWFLGLHMFPVFRLDFLGITHSANG